MKDKLEKDKRKDLLERYNRLKDSSIDWVKEHSDSMVEDDGLVHLKVDLRNAEVFNPYSQGKRIHSDIFEYIENEAIHIDPIEPLAIDLIVDEKDSEFKGLVAKEIKNHYLFKFSEAKANKKKVVGKSIGLLVIGILFLILYILLSVFASKAEEEGNGNLWLSISSEVISIVYWVFIWEATDKFFFERFEVQTQMLRLTQLVSAQVNFISENETKVKKLPSKKKKETNLLESLKN